mmetsp:Transcript_101130/g.163130  ORF Transcript_101130/g.163130 Transcript_101130/m.163130 type:complete len:120 (+) Transcript_101130:803-1162(+)
MFFFQTSLLQQEKSLLQQSKKISLLQQLEETKRLQLQDFTPQRWGNSIILAESRANGRLFCKGDVSFPQKKLTTSLKETSHPIFLGDVIVRRRDSNHVAKKDGVKKKLWSGEMMPTKME